jgi:hypothetical protein
MDRQQFTMKDVLEPSDLPLSLPSPEKPHCLLFVSFDISGNTEYKITNPSKVLSPEQATSKTTNNSLLGNSGWFDDVGKIFDELISKLASSETEFQFWKFQGDELILTVSIQELSEVISALRSIDGILRKISLAMWKEKQLLDMKATIWIAAIDGAFNRKFDLDVSSIHEGRTIQDYIGTSIDEGFRIASAVARSKRVAVSFDIAFLLVKERIEEMRNIYHVGFAELKGIWKQKPYPALWYSTECTNDRDITPYYFKTEGFATHCKLTQRFYASPDSLSEDTSSQTQTLTSLLENIYQHIPQAREHHDVVRSVLNLNPL